MGPGRTSTVHGLTLRKAVDGSAALTDAKSPHHHNGHQHGSGARHDDHGKTTLYTTGDQPKNSRATIPMTGGQRPENRHDRYASRNAGDVNDGTGDQASSDVTLRQQPVPVPSNRRFPLSGCTRQVCLQQRAGRCSKTCGLRWPALKADSTTTRHTRTDPAQRTLQA